jgi:predicted RNA-binding Zn ribbon-like protein
MFSHVAGRLSLDFANTVGSRGVPMPNERLTDPAALVAWGAETGILSSAAGGASETVLARAVALREAVYRIFSRVAAERAADPADLAVLNGVLGEAEMHVTRRDRAFARGWAPPERPEHILWAVAADAADLLTGPMLHRVGECAGEHCGWLFLDESKNGSRRWCDMRDCGNRAKARRHYQRQREG